ncbi:MAG TPA: heavy-metal-associated domain-containing protein [Patescibacteria group bacterium]|nr:heavy-metal-associated domain-containing protein [Patescibacteria group bacterium]
MITKKFKITGMHCSSCAMNIDGELEDTEGVKEAKTSFAKQTVEVEYDANKLNDKKITEIIKTAGYDATLLE